MSVADVEVRKRSFKETASLCLKLSAYHFRVWVWGLGIRAALGRIIRGVNFLFPLKNDPGT